MLADPGGCVRTYGTREDFLIPSACLNSTVSGLVSRTVLRPTCIGPDDFHGAKFYRELRGRRRLRSASSTPSAHSSTPSRPLCGAGLPDLLAVGPRPDLGGLGGGRADQRGYGIHDVNLVKPGVGETTRVLLRRVPWKILVREPDRPDHVHVRLLAAAARRAGRGGGRTAVLLRGSGPPDDADRSR